jgi:hypothetical protein
MATLRWFAASLALLTSIVPAMAGQAEVASDSPFGVVCPWPGIEKAGARWCRVGAGATAFVNWPEIEKSAGSWDWTAADNELKQLADPLGLSLLPILGYTPKWASRAPEDADWQFHPPRDVARFSRFAGQCVARYKHRVKVWEVWNEPNIGFFRGSAAEYAEMVKAAAVAARQADPDCRIAVGCAGVDLDFLQRLYEFGCGPYFDVMSVHPYQWGRQLNDGWMLDKLHACRQLMDRHGDSHKEIWITEIGWSLAEGVTPQDQANLLAQAMVTALSVRERLKVEKVFWFCVKDWGGPGHGLFDTSGKPKPALAAYRAVATELSGAHYRGTWKAPEGVRGHLFDRAGQPVLAIWTPSPDGKVQVEIGTSSANLALRTVSNNTVNVRPALGKASLSATHAPVFVTGLKPSELAIQSDSLPASPPPAAARKALGNAWLSVLPPPTTARPCLVLGRDNELPLRIHNDGRERIRGELQIELTGAAGALATGRVPFDAASECVQTVSWRVAIPPRKEQAGELATLHVRGIGPQEATGPVDLPIRLVRGKAIEFAANSWIEQQYLHKPEKSGCSESIRFGTEFGYRFDCRGAKSARLRINVGANGANPWSVSLSKDDKQYALECKGKSWPGWQTIALDKYLPGAGAAPATVYVRIQGTDCQVREVVLDTEDMAH